MINAGLFKTYKIAFLGHFCSNLGKIFNKLLNNSVNLISSDQQRGSTNTRLLKL